MLIDLYKNLIDNITEEHLYLLTQMPPNIRALPDVNSKEDIDHLVVSWKDREYSIRELVKLDEFKHKAFYHEYMIVIEWHYKLVPIYLQKFGIDYLMVILESLIHPTKPLYYKPVGISVDDFDVWDRLNYLVHAMLNTSHINSFGLKVIDTTPYTPIDGEYDSVNDINVLVDKLLNETDYKDIPLLIYITPQNAKYDFHLYAFSVDTGSTVELLPTEEIRGLPIYHIKDNTDYWYEVIPRDEFEYIRKDGILNYEKSAINPTTGYAVFTTDISRKSL